MKKILSSKVAKNFSGSAETYDGAAVFQRRAANAFSEFISSSGSAPRKILEIGCGTGFLTERLMGIYPSASFTVSDISVPMLRICERKTEELKNQKDIRVKYLVSDMTEAIEEDAFDMIASALVFQWAEDLQAALEGVKKKLAPGGAFYFSILTKGTLEGIMETFRASGVKYPGPELMPFESIREICLSVFSELRERNCVYSDEYASILDFLKHIKAVGAGNATGKILNAPELRKVIRNKNRALNAEYHLAFFECVK